MPKSFFQRLPERQLIGAPTWVPPHARPRTFLQRHPLLNILVAGLGVAAIVLCAGGMTVALREIVR